MINPKVACNNKTFYKFQALFLEMDAASCVTQEVWGSTMAAAHGGFQSHGGNPQSSSIF